MSYKRSNQQGNLFANGIVGVLITAALFITLPLMQTLASWGGDDGRKFDSDNSVPPPPPPPDEMPPPPEEQEEIEKPEMKEPPPPMTLMQMEMALNPGAGDAVGDFGFADFQGIDALDSMQIFDIQDLDKRPRALFQVDPNYPYSLQQAQIEGWSIVEFIITEKGTVTRARSTKSSHREFENPAVESIMRSKWQPGKKDGKNVNVRVRQKILFTL